ncbi:Mor transcription activator family protein [compost metagenome]
MILIRHFGGSDYWFPSKNTINPAHELAELIGFNNFKKLCQYWDNALVYIPKADRYLGVIRDKRIEQDLCEIGATTKIQQELANKYNVSTRWIRTIRKNQLTKSPKPIKQDKQLDMFA